MTLAKPLAFLDLETDGADEPDVTTDRIVTLSIRKVDELPPPPVEIPIVETLWFNPGAPLRRTAIHGISEVDVAGKPAFKELAAEIMANLRGCDLAGYNHSNYDVPLLYEEFHRAGLRWDMTGVRLLDVGSIFKKMERRDLSAALKFYCAREHTGAHGSAADVTATIDVAAAQLARYPELDGMTFDALAAFSIGDDRHHGRVDLAGIIVLNEEGVPVFNTKRNRGVPVVRDPGYAHWMLDKGFFPANTKHALEKILRIPKQEAFL
jgi:DNA polymerase-3 subunit epsilon